MNAKSSSLFILFGVFVLLAAPNLMIEEVRTWTNPSTHELVFHVNVHNAEDSDTESVRVSAHILGLYPELYERTFSRQALDAEERNSRMISMFIPYDVAPGLYITKIVASSDEYTDSKFVWTYIPQVF